MNERGADDATDEAPQPGAAERLRCLARIWPALDETERHTLYLHLHRLRESASAA